MHHSFPHPSSLLPSTQCVGFIGLGNMGGPMANNLIQSGHRLVVFDLVESAMQDAVGAGAQRAGSPAEVRGERHSHFVLFLQNLCW